MFALRPMRDTKSQTKKIRPFTLIEMMVVFILISTVAAFGSISVGHLLAKQRFLGAVSRFEGLLQICQDTMLLYGVDVDVNIDVDHNGLVINLLSSRKMNEPLAQYFTEPYRLKPIRKAVWKGGGDVKALQFISPGSKMTKGQIVLLSANARWRKVIVLPGYPDAIAAGQKGRELPPLQETQELSEQLYPKEIENEIF